MCSAFGLNEEFYTKAFLLLSGLAVGRGTSGVSQCCEIRNNSLDTWPSLSEERRGIQG